MKSLRSNEGNNRTEAAVAVGIAVVAAEAEDARISTIVAATATSKPRIVGLDKERVITIPGIYFR